MENLLALLKEYGRFLELADSVPDWKRRRPAMKARLRELKVEWDLKDAARNKLAEPNFFTRLFGRMEEKQEKASKACREARDAYEAAKAELDALEARIARGEQELESLSQSQSAYLGARKNAVLTSLQEGQLAMEEIAAFTPAALGAADRILEALEDAAPWARADANRRSISPDNQKMAHLTRAEEQSARLLDILAVMPEGVANVGPYLKNPGGYIYGVTSEYAQLDRLNSAMEQVRETRNQLRMLQ